MKIKGNINDYVNTRKSYQLDTYNAPFMPLPLLKATLRNHFFVLVACYVERKRLWILLCNYLRQVLLQSFFVSTKESEYIYSVIS